MNNASSAMLHDEVPVRRCLMQYNPLTMISTESLSQEWLESVSKELGYPDKGSLEIVKQIFDIGRLFDNVQDFSPAFESFRRVSVLELSYRGLSRIKSFMFRCTYLIESAITDSAKAAYLATCFQ